MKKVTYLVLLFILLGGFLVRLYKFTSPIADWHSWRQVDTSAVSRTFVTSGFDLLHPKFEDISNVPSGLDNPQGYRFVEFPLYNILQAGTFLLFDHFTLETWGRLVTAVMATFSILFIFLLTKKHANDIAGLSAAFFFAFMPYNIYYGRVVLPDPSMVTALLAGVYFFDIWLDTLGSKSNKIGAIIFFLLACLFTASALLLKPYALFFGLVFLVLAGKKWGWKLFLQWKLYVFLVVCIIPLAFWRLWMQQFPQGIPASAWLFNQGNIRFKPAFFYWLFAQRIGKLLLGYWGATIFIIGLLAKRKKDFLFFFSWLVSSLIYMSVIARGNVQHDYYQILIVPSITMFLGLGIDFFVRQSKELLSKKITYPIIGLLVIFMLTFSWYFIRDYYNINNPSLLVAGAAVDRLTPKNARIVAPYGGDTTLLYQTNRQGWPSFEHDLPQLITMGADYLVLVNPKPADYDIGKTYKIVSATSDYILFNLHQKP